ncbi:AMP-binding protein [Streptomyces sioyaensis]|uniref:AMP-binding protein n=1 Tax=Streptomyces sioyaensis TaxID=67364 RepID=UPI0037A2F4F4
MFRSEYADIAPVELPIHEAVLGRAAEYVDRPALVDGLDGSTLSYARLDHLSRRIAAALAASGLRKGEVLALHSPNSVLFPAVFYAATRCGAAVTTVHPLATEVPKAFVVRQRGAHLTEDDVIAYVASQVAPYKKVRRVEFLASVPRAATGKILRRELRARERSSTPR